MTPTDEQPAEKSTVANPPEITVPCSVCREPIKHGARKCIHCSSMLDWRGWLGISETALALLVALVSVVGASAPRLVELLTPKSSELRLSIRQVFAQNLELAAWNQGHKSSQLVSAKISAKTQEGSELEPVPLQITGYPTVAGEQQTLFGLSIHPSLVPTFLNWPHPRIQSAILIVVVNEYKKLPESRNIEVPVAYFRLLCRATEDADTQARHPGQAVDNRLASRCVMPTPQ
jgi:hypothetical protein